MTLTEGIVQLGKQETVVEVILSYLPKKGIGLWCLQVMFEEVPDRLFNPRKTIYGPDPMLLIDGMLKTDE